jgi:hypothetical protein
MGFPTSTKKRGPILDALVSGGVISKGDYRSKRSSRLYCLSDDVVKAMDDERISSPAVA